MDVTTAAAILGKLGGLAKAARHDREQITAVGRANRRPDEQVSAHALYMREYRRGKRRRKATEEQQC